MISGTHIKQGEIWLVPYPYTDLSNIKKRPVLILSKENFNNNQENLIVLQISSIIKSKNYSITINNENISKGYLKNTSEIRIQNFSLLNKKIFIHKIAKINEYTINQCLNKFESFMKENIYS